MSFAHCENKYRGWVAPVFDDPFMQLHMTQAAASRTRLDGYKYSVHPLDMQNSVCNELDRDVLLKMSLLSCIDSQPCHLCFLETKSMNKQFIYKYLNQLASFFASGLMPVVISDIINGYVIDSSEMLSAMCKDCYYVVMSKKPKENTKEKRKQECHSSLEIRKKR